MDGLADLLGLLGPVVLGHHHRRAGGKAHEKAHQQIDEGPGAAANGGQGLLAHEISHDDGIGGIIKLLKKRPEQNREKEAQKLLPDDALGDTVARPGGFRHLISDSFLRYHSSIAYSFAPVHRFAEKSKNCEALCKKVESLRKKRGREPFPSRVFAFALSLRYLFRSPPPASCGGRSPSGSKRRSRPAAPSSFWG